MKFAVQQVGQDFGVVQALTGAAAVVVIADAVAVVAAAAAAVVVVVAGAVGFVVCAAVEVLDAQSHVEPDQAIYHVVDHQAYADQSQPRKAGFDALAGQGPRPPSLTRQLPQ